MNTELRKHIIALFLVLLPGILFSTEIGKTTEIYSVRNKEELKMDIYRSGNNDKQACLIFVFGGGFKMGARDQEYIIDYLNYFAKSGFTVVSIDYRLGLKSVEAKGLKFVKALRGAINVAVEDIYSATDYINKNAARLQIDTTKIILSGSSAGAISVLHADYEHSNHFNSDTILNRDFKYAGIISYAGAILSNEGLPKYIAKPAPTLFFHGKQDKLVTYDKIQLFNLGFFGSKYIVKQFKKSKFQYIFYTMENSGHEVAVYPMNENREEILYFIKNLVKEKKPWMQDVILEDASRKPTLNMNSREFYKSKDLNW